jgi:hypothetical protein
MTGPLGGGVGDPRAPTINAKNVNDDPPRRRSWGSGSTHHQNKRRRRWAPWVVVPTIRERPPSMLNTSMADPQGGAAEDSGAPTTNAKNVNGWPRGRRCRQHPPSTQKTWTVSPLRGGARDLGVPTINTKKCRWRAPWKAVRRSGSPHHQRKKMLMADPLEGGAGDQGVPTINAKKCRRRTPSEAVPEMRECLPSTLKNVDGGPPGTHYLRSVSAHHQC